MHKKFQTLLGDCVTKVCTSQTKFVLVHQFAFPCERVGSGEETRVDI